MSTLVHKTIMNANYLQIMSMGPAVLPFILRELERRPDHWFVALENISANLGGNPPQNDSTGDIEKMRRAWLDWGQREGIF